MLKRNVMYVDAIIGQLNQLCQTWRAEYGQSLDQVVNVPVSTIVFDVLKAIGMPDNGAELVLAIQNHFTDPPAGENQLACTFCDQQASYLVQMKNGDMVLACFDHADEADDLHFPVISGPRGCELEL